MMSSNQRLMLGIAGAVLLAAAGTAVVARQYGGSAPVSAADSLDAALPEAGAEVPETDGEYRFSRLADPARTAVQNGDGQTLAVFTDGARTVRLAGPARTFAEPEYTDAKVTTTAWIRLAPQEWQEGAENEDWFRPWLEKALKSRAADVLATAMQYVTGADRKKDREGLQVAGDAEFGPLSDKDPDGRAENSDFYDYLGVSWSFPDGKREKPSESRLRSLDCSGYIRMVYGYRLGYPLRGTNTKGVGLPRRAYAMAQFGPGVQLMPNTGRQATELDRLQPGDLLFFNAGPVQNAHIEHSGIFLGLDSAGHYRFISSRATANGPTLGDAGGASILDGNDAYWAVRFRTARRI
jgi:cell wall-associated NlpC family hydrolase